MNIFSHMIRLLAFLAILTLTGRGIMFLLKLCRADDDCSAHPLPVSFLLGAGALTLAAKPFPSSVEFSKIEA